MAMTSFMKKISDSKIVNFIDLMKPRGDSLKQKLMRTESAGP